jgi:hypothetical protein
LPPSPLSSKSNIASAMAVPTKAPATLASRPPAIMPPIPMPPPMPMPPMPRPGRLKVRSSVPGWRTSARVAIRASDRGSSDCARSPGGTSALSSVSTCRRCSGVSFANASACACSTCSGGAVRSR